MSTASPTGFGLHEYIRTIEQVLDAWYKCQNVWSYLQPVFTSADIAKAHVMRGKLGLPGGQLIANPIPAEAEIARDVMIPVIEQANRDAQTHGISGKDTTPYLLQRIYELTEGKSLVANIELVLNNARLAAQIAVEMCNLPE